jgi:uncharacterized protein (DUF58 family)
MNAMWFRDILRRKSNANRAGASRKQAANRTRFVPDEAFLRRLERLGLEAQRTLRGRPVNGEHPSREQMPQTVFSDHRPYSAGDDYRYIDWNAYARHEQFVVRLGEAEQSVDVHVLLDISRSMAWGTPPKLVVGQELVAALSYLAMAQNDRLRITPFHAMPLPSFGPVQGKGRLVEMLRFVEGAQISRQAGLAQAVTRYARMHERGGLLVICSDMLAAPADDLAEALRAVPAPRWQVLVLHLLDQQEVQPNLQGPLELEDSENGERLELVLDAETVAAYRREVAAWQAQLATACARRGATYARVMTDWPLERIVIPYLQARRVLQ